MGRRHKEEFAFAQLTSTSTKLYSKIDGREEKSKKNKKILECRFINERRRWTLKKLWDVCLTGQRSIRRCKNGFGQKDKWKSGNKNILKKESRLTEQKKKFIEIDQHFSQTETSSYR